MLQITNWYTASKSTVIGEANTKEILGSIMVDEANIVGKVKKRASKSETKYLISGIRLTFGLLRQTFNTTLILHHFHLDYYI